MECEKINIWYSPWRSQVWLLILHRSVRATTTPLLFLERAIFGEPIMVLTPKKAREKALKKCHLRGGRKCKIVMWSNRCSSLTIFTSGRGGYRTGSGTSHDQARQSAKETCRKGNWICRTGVSTCEDDGTEQQIWKANKTSIRKIR